MAAARPPTTSGPPASPVQPTPAATSSRTDSLAQATTSGTREQAARETPAGRSYVVRNGDTAYSIARSYRVNVAALLSANPGVNPQRLRPGQTLAIPVR